MEKEEKKKNKKRKKTGEEKESEWTHPRLVRVGWGLTVQLKGQFGSSRSKAEQNCNAIKETHKMLGGTWLPAVMDRIFQLESEWDMWKNGKCFSITTVKPTQIDERVGLEHVVCMKLARCPVDFDQKLKTYEEAENNAGICTVWRMSNGAPFGCQYCWFREGGSIAILDASSIDKKVYTNLNDAWEASGSSDEVLAVTYAALRRRVLTVAEQATRIYSQDREKNFKKIK